jgi:hypothetical protein
MGAERILNEPTGGWESEIKRLSSMNVWLVQYHNRFFKPKAKPAKVDLSGNLPQIALRLAQTNGVLCEKINKRKKQ